MIVEQSREIIEEVNKAFIGKNNIIEKVLMTIYAGGHVLLEDCPGVGKTTLALAFAKVLGLSNKRIQFTTDTLPSDITGFNMYNREKNQFEYREGAANCQLLLADEINRTSPKTQAALLEVMEEHTISLDGVTHELPVPFVCIATENPLGFAGTQPLPESQLDRFMVCLSIGYPTLENQMKIINAQRYSNPLLDLRTVTSAQNILEVQNYLTSVRMTDSVLKYAILLCEETREHPLVELGISPRGVSALVKMAKASAVLNERISDPGGCAECICRCLCPQTGHASTGTGGGSHSKGASGRYPYQSQTCISRRKVSRYVEKSVRLYPCFFRMYDTAVCLQQTFYALFGRSAYDACCGNVSVPSKGYPEYRDSVDNCAGS